MSILDETTSPQNQPITPKASSSIPLNDQSSSPTLPTPANAAITATTSVLADEASSSSASNSMSLSQSSSAFTTPPASETITRDEDPPSPDDETRRDSHGSSVHEQLVDALSGKERIYTLKVAEELEKFILSTDPNNDAIHFSPPTGYQRLIVYRCCAYMGLSTMTSTEGVGKAVVITKAAEARVPTRRICDILPAPAQPVTVQPFKIMRREPGVPPSHSRSTNSLHGASRSTSTSGGSDSGSTDGVRKTRTFEERQADYDNARMRIFKSQIPAGSAANVTAPSGVGGSGSAVDTESLGDKSVNGSSSSLNLASSSAMDTVSPSEEALQLSTSTKGDAATGAVNEVARSLSSLSLGDPSNSAKQRRTSNASASSSASSVPVVLLSPTGSLRPSAPEFAPTYESGNPSFTFGSVVSSTQSHSPVAGAIPESYALSANGGSTVRGAQVMYDPDRSAGRSSNPQRNQPKSRGSHRGGLNQQNGRGGYSQYEGSQHQSGYPPQSAPNLPHMYNNNQAHIANGQHFLPPNVPSQDFTSPPATHYIFVPNLYNPATGHPQGAFVPPFQQTNTPVPNPVSFGAQVYGYQQSTPVAYGLPVQYPVHSYPPTPQPPTSQHQPYPYQQITQQTNQQAQQQHWAMQQGMGQQPQTFAHLQNGYRDGVSSAPPYLPQGAAFRPSNPQNTSYSSTNYASPQPQRFPTTSSTSSFSYISNGNGRYPSESSVSSGSRPQSRGSNASSSVSGMMAASSVSGSNGRQQPWSGLMSQRNSFGSRRRSSVGTGTDRPSSPSSTTSSAARARESALAHIPPPAEGQHPLPPRPDWSVGNLQFDLRRPDPASGPRLSNNDFPPLAGMQRNGSGSQPYPRSSEGAWQQPGAIKAIINNTSYPNSPAPHAVAADSRTSQMASDSSPDNNTFQVVTNIQTNNPNFNKPPFASEISRMPSTSSVGGLSSVPSTRDDEFEVRRPAPKSGLALFDPSSGEKIVAVSSAPVVDERTAEVSAAIDAKLAAINAQLPPSSLSYSSVLRRN